ncbi:MAG: PD-(D/E)XK nuclease family protein [bacterium]
MANEEKIKIIHIDLPFLKNLADYFVSKFKGNIPDFSKILVVFPSERNKFYFRRYLLEKAKVKGMIPPTMFTIDELVNYIYERSGGKRAKILHSIERNFLLKKTIDNLKIELWQNLPFLRFISIGNRLLDFFDELSQEKIAIEDIEKKSKELHFAERYITDELPILKKVYQQYRKNLVELDYLDEIDKFEKIYENYNSKIFADFKFVIVAGIAALTSFEKFIIQKIIMELPAELILHSGTKEELSQSDDVHKRYFLHNKLLKDLNVDIKNLKIIDKKSTIYPVIHIKPFETATKQAFYLGNIVVKAIKKYKPHRIGIVLTDESLIFPVTEILRSHGIEYNLSAGIPFDNQIFYSFLSHLFEAVKCNLHHTEFFIFLQHPLIKNAIINDVLLRPLVYKLRNEMIKNKKGYFDKIFFNNESELVPLLNFLERCITTVQQNLPLNEYIENLHQLLDEVLLFNKEIIKKSLPGIKEFFNELEHLAQLRIEHITFRSGIDMLEFILEVLKDGRYHIQGEPLKGVQIIGILEARNLDFDCLVIPSMNEGIFPRRSDKDMFINPALRREMGLVTKQERDNLYYYYFTQLISGKREVFLSYIAEEKKDIPSRFIIALESTGHKEEQELITFSRSAIKVPEHRVEKDSKLMKSLLKLCNRGLSPSLLKTYKSCPYQFYLKYILRIEELETITEEIDALNWGSLFHVVVSEFYKKHYPDGFHRDQQDRAVAKFEEILHQYIKSGNYIAVPPKPITYFNLALYRIYIKKFVENELKRFDEGYRFVREYIEKYLTSNIDIGGRSIVLKGYIDRVDVKNNEYYIIDYKTGRGPERKSYEVGEEFIEFQLPLYAFLFLKNSDKKIGGLMYYIVGSETKISEIFQKDDVIDYLNRFRDKILIPTIEEILDIETPFYQTANKDICRICAYSSVCGRYKYEGD